jgi:thymidylate synthase
MLEYDSINDAQIGVLQSLLRDGHWVSPRGLATIETTFCNFSIRNPRKRLLTLKQRRWSLPLAIGEFCWQMSGSDDPEFIGRYAKQWAKLADSNGRILGSCYGKRIFEPLLHGEGQWQSAQQLLQVDPQSRRAVLFFNIADSRMDPDAPDVACASSMQFLLREGALDAVVTMRSNDAVLGLPYDVFLFTMFQEIMAFELGVGLGHYFHSIGSVHVYERHMDLIRRMVACDAPSDMEMPPIANIDELHKFLQLEQALRQGVYVGDLLSGLGGYWRDLANVLVWYHTRNSGGAVLKPFEALAGPYESLLSALPY